MIAAELKQELDLRILVCTYWTLPDVAKSYAEILEKQSNVLHAGEAETSMLLHLKPDLVDQDALQQADGPAELKMMGPGAYRWNSFKSISPNGGDRVSFCGLSRKRSKVAECGIRGALPIAGETGFLG